MDLLSQLRINSKFRELCRGYVRAIVAITLLLPLRSRGSAVPSNGPYCDRCYLLQINMEAYRGPYIVDDSL